MKNALFSLVLSLFFSINTCGNTQNFEPCYTDRKVDSEIKDLSLICISTGDQAILSELPDGGRRFSVCNSSEFPMEVKVTYSISGILYEMKANERWPGAPLQITRAKKKE